MMKSESIKEIAVALALVQSTIQDATIDSNNPHFKSDYASLEAYLKVARPSLAENGLAIMQGVNHQDHVLETTLLHKSGEYIGYTMPLILTKNDMQGLGSAVTYARRYSLAAILGIGQEDDDGNAAAEGDQEKNQQKKAAGKSGAKVAAKTPYYTKADELGKTVIPYGSSKGKKLKDLSRSQVIAWVKHFENKAAKTALEGAESEFARATKDYLDAMDFDQAHGG